MLKGEDGEWADEGRFEFGGIGEIKVFCSKPRLIPLCKLMGGTMLVKLHGLPELGLCHGVVGCSYAGLELVDEERGRSR